jgi:hypothetical protein
MKPGTDCGFFVERAALFLWLLGCFVLKGRTEIKPHFSKAATALLHACNKAAAAFKKAPLFQHGRS